MTPDQKRSFIAGLSMSAIALAGVIGREGFTDHAVIPIPGDRPTYGHGSTFRPDGSPVQMGDKITIQEARALIERDTKNIYEVGIKKCAGDIPMLPREFDFLVDSSINLGTPTVCKSGMVRNFRAGNYAAGCAYIKQYKFAVGKDCSIPANKCMGIPIDRERSYKMCMGIA